MKPAFSSAIILFLIALPAVFADDLLIDNFEDNSWGK
tara:strand:+ start:948 stop:1058 length:111 start_codon:yes stop_codon:yes gene_type:complete